MSYSSLFTSCAALESYDSNEDEQWPSTYLFLSLLRFYHFFGIEISSFQCFVEVFECDALNHGDGVDDVPQGFAHLTAVGVADHSVKVNLQ